MKKRLKESWVILKRSAKKYKKDDPVKLAGTTAYFTVFAMAPIIIIIVSVIGILLGQEKIQEKVFSELTRLIGSQGTEYINSLVSNFQGTERGVTGTIVGVLVFLFTSTTFFKILQNSLNFIWRIRVKATKNFLKNPTWTSQNQKGKKL